MVESAPIIEHEVTEPKPDGAYSYFDYLVLKNEDRLVSKIPDYTNFSDHLSNASYSHERYTNMVNQKIDRLISADQHAKDRIVEVTSTATASTAYLRMVEEFEGKITRQQTLEFFKACLLYSDFSSKPLIQPSGEEYRRKNIIALNSSNFSEQAKSVRKYAGNPPAWFAGSKAGWISFFVNHATFLVYANPNAYKMRVNKSKDVIFSLNEREWKSITVESARPEWLDGAMDNVPTVDEVKEELFEDEKEYQALTELRKHYHNNRHAILSRQEQKWMKGMIHFENKRRLLESRNKDVMQTLLYLDATRSTVEHPVPAENERLNPTSLSEKTVSPKQSQERVIREFVKRGYKENDVVALWIEDKIRIAKRDMDKTTLDGMLVFLSSHPTDNDFYELKSQDKLYHNLLKFSINPLFKLLTSEERRYLVEYSQVTQSPFELLSELTELISDHLKVGKDKAPMVVEDIKKFTSQWLKRNSDGLVASRIKEILRGKSFNDDEKKSMKDDEQIVSATLQEIIAEEEVLKHESLPGWRIRLMSDYNPDKTNEIKGDTLDEYVACLDKQFLANGQAYAIKTSSIVNALDWFLGVPDKIRQLWAKQNINGVEYYKIKRGSVRIFCNLDPDTHELSFFPYQKKSMDYRFRS